MLAINDHWVPWLTSKVVDRYWWRVRYRRKVTESVQVEVHKNYLFGVTLMERLMLKAKPLDPATVFMIG